MVFVMLVRTIISYYAPYFQPEKAEMEHVLTIEAPSETTNAVQGAVFDGEYYYVAFIDRTTEYHTAIIVQTDAEGNEIKRSEVLPVDHANSITILENGNLMVSHCYSPDGHTNRYSVLDKDTFEIVEVADLNETAMAIAYDGEKECFVTAEGIAKKMNVYTKDMELKESFEVDFLPETQPQSYFCTDNKIYTVRFSYNEGVFLNYLYVYSYDAKTLLEYEMEMPDTCEAEAVSVVDKDIYIICADSGKCEIYKMKNMIAWR